MKGLRCYITIFKFSLTELKIYKIQSYKLHTWLWLSQSRRYLKSVCLKMAIVLGCRIWTGREFQSFAPAYASLANNVSSRSSQLLTLRRNLKIPNSCPGQFKIVKISTNLKNILLLSKVKCFSSLRISWVHLFLPTFSIILIARFCTSSTRTRLVIVEPQSCHTVEQLLSRLVIWFVCRF